MSVATSSAAPAPFPLRILLDRLGNSEAELRELPWFHLLPEAVRNRSADVLRFGGSEAIDVQALLGAGSAAVPGNVWRLSKDANGCREVQNALDSASTDAERQALASELRGNVDKAARCPHANHVIQKIIVSLKPLSCQFIIDEIMAAGLLPIAKHKYGCRIIQRLVEHCEDKQVEGVIDMLIANFLSLARTPYSNFVLQHLLDHGPEDVQEQMMALAVSHAVDLAAHPHGCAVVVQALETGNMEQRSEMVRRMLKERGLLVAMAGTRHGHVAAKTVLERGAVEDGLREEAEAVLAAARSELESTKYGELVAACLSA